MKIILFTHYSLFKTASMPRFARMIAAGMRQRGHEVEEWSCPVILGDKVSHPFFAKWLGYIDQFILFPLFIRRRLKSEPPDTLFVITDQALGPWVPLVADRPHVVHCHDFLAQRSALGEFPENPTGLTGRLYQAYIRRGYRKGRNFISVSKKTQEDLHRFLDKKPTISEVVYNGLNYPFCPLPAREAMARLEAIPAFREILASQSFQKNQQRTTITGDPATSFNNQQPTIDNSEAPLRFILHVGGNQWYKNREGVVLTYRQYCQARKNPVALVIIGSTPSSYLQALTNEVPNGGQVFLVTEATDEQVHAAYALSTVLLFPSLEEGFGWPIAEAMACGCPVITTDQAPMTEVGGDAAFYVNRKGAEKSLKSWAIESAAILDDVVNMPDSRRVEIVKSSLLNAVRFDTNNSLNQTERTYLRTI